ncbi:MAG: hypothetical protein K2M14_00625 [Muribaculaceae bacterium]|nr:hypothetical protein [Muribaculaceae bacterium]
MKKIYCNLALLATMLVMLFGLGACSDDAESLLETVPADSQVVVTIDGDEWLKSIDYKNRDGKPTFCPEMDKLLKTTGVDHAMVNNVADALELTEKVFVLFVNGQDAFLTFNVKDADKFRAWVEKHGGKSFADEGKGFYRLSSGDFVMKDKQVWASLSGKIETDRVERFLDLGKKNRFSEKFSGIASSMTGSGRLISGFLNINEVFSLLHKIGETQTAAQMQFALGMAFKDAAYLTFDASVSSDKSESSLRVLNKDEEPAEFLIPMSRINTAALNKIDNRAFCVGAIDISPDLTNMLGSLMKTYGSTMGPEERAVADTFLSMQGTSAFSVNNADEVLVSLGFKNPEKAQAAAGIIKGFTSGSMRVGTTGNFVVVGTGKAANAGSSPKGFGDAYIALYFDYANPSMKDIMPVDCSDMGTVLMTLEPDGKGAKLKSVWNVNKPICTALRLANAYLDMMSAPRSFSYEDMDEEPYFGDDSTAIDFEL